MRSSALGLTLCVALLASCGGASDDAREDEITGVMAEADEPVIRARRELAAGKYVRMVLSPIEFLRGSLPIYRHDSRAGTSLESVSDFAMDLPLVPSIGDPHIENFGALRASDDSLALEPNDFDAADQAPYLWDVRRLATSMVIAASTSNPDDPAARALATAAARDIAHATVLAYRDGVASAAAGMPLGRFTEASPGADSPVIADVFSRSDRDEATRAELPEFTTVLPDGTRHFMRGGVDPTDNQSVLDDLPPAAYAALPAAIETWRQSLLVAIPPAEVTLLDAVREMGAGVSSWPRVRVLLLVRGPTDDPGDDRLLELKELTDSGIAGLYPPGIYADDVGQRILHTTRQAWGRPDGEWRWGVTTWVGLPCQIKTETEGAKNVRVSRLTDDLGTPAAISALGTALGTIVARIHTSGPDGLTNAKAIYARINIDPDRFVDEQTNAAFDYAQTTLSDAVRFRRALLRRGLALGIPFDPSDAPKPDLAALFGTPPPVPTLQP